MQDVYDEMQKFHLSNKIKLNKVLKSGELSELSIHKAAIQWCHLNPNLKGLVIHIPNEGKRSRRYGRTLKELGMLAGASDLFIALAKKEYHGAWIEIKSKQGILSPLQKQFLEKMNQQGYFTAVCYSLDEIISILNWYIDL